MKPHILAALVATACSALAREQLAVSPFWRVLVLYGANGLAWGRGENPIALSARNF